MRTITLSTAGIARTMEPVPGTDGWFAVAGLDLEARKKVFIFLEGPAAQAAREEAGKHGGVHVMVTDEQVVASLPMEEDEEPGAEAPTRRRAKCVYCGKTKPVTKSGKIRKHYIVGGPTTTSAGMRVVCGGSGRDA